MTDTEREIELIKEKLELMERLLEVEKELKDIEQPRLVQPNPIIIPRPQPIIVPDPCPPKPCRRDRIIWEYIPERQPEYTSQPITICTTNRDLYGAPIE